MLRNPFDMTEMGEDQPHRAGPDRVPFMGAPSEPGAPAAPAPMWRRFLFGLFRWAVLRWAIAGMILLLFVTMGWLALTAPLSRSLRPVAPPSVTLLASNGQVITRRGAVIDKAVDVKMLPAHVGEAFIAIEDRRFYHHWGVDPHGILRAAWHNLRARGVREGGSTITQQLAKQVFLNSDRTMGRKAREVLIAFWLEAWLSKDEILSRYLSDVYFGDNVYGLRAASWHYFSKPPERLSIAEAAMLAGLMKAPSKLAPSSNLAGAQARGRLVIGAMADAGFITPAEATHAAPAALHLRPVPQTTNSSYFADWVLPAARDRMGDDYAEPRIRTTLDARLQRAAEATAAQVRTPGMQVAILAMKPDGRVLAMVGGRDYGDSPFNRAVQARRQPGSTFKLFVYLAALRAGMTPDDRVDDKPITINGWSPVNADRTYRGSITLREAFAHSSNVAAVRLTQKVGPEAVVKAARDLGVASPLTTDPTIALGTSGVSLLELTSAYAAVAGNSYPVQPHGLPDDGQQEGWLSSLWPRTHSFGSSQHAMLLDLLSATVKQGTAKGAALNTQVFGKTGTTQENRDALFVGFAGGIVTAVWVGRDDNAPLKGIAGGGLPAQLWRSFMAQAIHARPLGARPPVSVDPDALDLDLGKLIGNLSMDLHIGRDGVHIGGGDPKPVQPGDGAGADDDHGDGDGGE